MATKLELVLLLWHLYVTLSWLNPMIQSHEFLIHCIVPVDFLEESGVRIFTRDPLEIPRFDFQQKKVEKKTILKVHKNSILVYYGKNEFSRKNLFRGIQKVAVKSLSSTGPGGGGVSPQILPKVLTSNNWLVFHLCGHFVKFLLFQNCTVLRFWFKTVFWLTFHHLWWDSWFFKFCTQKMNYVILRHLEKIKFQTFKKKLSLAILAMKEASNRFST